MAIDEAKLFRLNVYLHARFTRAGGGAVPGRAAQTPFNLMDEARP